LDSRSGFRVHSHAAFRRDWQGLAGLTVLLLTLSSLLPALDARAAPPAAPPAAAPTANQTTLDEVIITGRRGPTPDFQESYEFHKAELARLKAIVDPDPPPAYSPAERKIRMPETLTGTLPGKPTITETLR
jgi:hypothetical protein